MVENAKAALTFFFLNFSVALLLRSRSVTDKVLGMGGTGVRRHCAEASDSVLFQCYQRIVVDVGDKKEQ